MKETYHSEIQTIKVLRSELSGFVKQNEKDIAAQLVHLNGTHLLRIDSIVDLNTNDQTLTFFSNESNICISAVITSHKNSVAIGDKLVSRCSEAKVYSFWNKDLENNPIFCRSYYFANNRLLYDLCGNPHLLNLTVKGVLINLRCQGDFLIVENEAPMTHEDFSEIAYKVLVAIGFVSGNFVQGFSYTFSRQNKHDNVASAYKYQKLRKGSASIYHALTGNPYGYKHMLGKEVANALYNDPTVKCIDSNTLSKLCNIVVDSDQMQYALVLFNDANSNEVSLLIKNNCFFGVIEVLIKYFESKFKSKLPQNYSQLGNVKKFHSLFSLLFPVTQSEVELYKYRNTMFHGDIKDLEGREMLNIMLKQISLIYKILLTYVDFDGAIIDHYALRSNQPNEAFIKLTTPTDRIDRR